MYAFSWGNVYANVNHNYVCTLEKEGNLNKFAMTNPTYGSFFPILFSPGGVFVLKNFTITSTNEVLA